ncbi:probable chlorophyll(ide) b reductase NYC1, chloroplastic isoform X1 [Olea europaea var. sylvestris]|uniref:probable chlorophyll(ide) b reductase NYC1, chloroplastic isoform X1 n=1 Tax=Olea europaea var. sylvestris TaxID=158386 RepID=UPI000C1D3F82|nr:probable chlorophyll(ide) b reductase NYC1, chloroplastic isoform X1 [Olea europaea var. sylvestris]
MAMVAKLPLPSIDCHHAAAQPPPSPSSRQILRHGFGLCDRLGRGRIFVQPCRSFRSEEESGMGEKGKNGEENFGKINESNIVEAERSVNKFVGSVRNAVWTVSKPSLRSQGEFREALEKLEEKLFSLSIHVGRYIVTMLSTGVILLTGFQLSGGDGQMNALIWYSWLGGIIIGTMIGSNMVLEEVSRSGPRNVVITGSTRGLGKALAREFLLSGDRVVVTSRSPESVDMTVKELEENLKQVIIATGGSSKTNLRHAKVRGIACDVSKPDDVQKLASFAVNELAWIDIWVNNAGTNKGFRPLLQFNDDDIQQIVSTNLVGSILCTREAMQLMNTQNKGGHIFNMDGAGSGGSSTPLTAVYGSTKCGLRQLQSSLLKECRRSKVGVHAASPGMVLTDLLLRYTSSCISYMAHLVSGSSVQNKQMFNIICELPETVARTLVPRMRIVKGSGKAINYLTPPRIILALVTAWVRRGRWFDDQGRALYAAEADRLRNWAESRTRFSFTDAMEMYSENTWVSVFSLSVVCAFIILSSTGSTFPGT